MIEITRGLARQFRAVLRSSLLDQQPRGDWPLLLIRADARGLCLQAHKGDLAVQYHQPGARPEAVLTFRTSVLAEIEGRRHVPVSLEQTEPGHGRASWDEAGAPAAIDFETVSPDNVSPFPDLPRRCTPAPPGLIPALVAAGRVTGERASRFALAHLQLRGKEGEVVATDGHQLLIQGDLPLPWSESVLVPRLPALARKDLLPREPVRLSRTKTHVVLGLAAWTFLLRIDSDSRYPEVHGAVPSPRGVTSRLRIDPDDALLLLKNVPALPGQDEDRSPITLDLHTPPRIRVRGPAEDRAIELVLARSEVVGQPHLVCLDRTYLLRALDLGFRELEVCQPDQPLVCREAQRLYEWLPLAPRGVVPPLPDTLQEPSAADLVPAVLPPTTQRMPTMSTPPNGHPAPPPPPGPTAPPGESRPDTGNGHGPPVSLETLLAEADQIRALVQEAGARMSRLGSGLKQLRRHNRVFEQAVASLRQLQLDR